MNSRTESKETHMKRRALLQTSFLLPLTLIASNPAFASVKRLRIGVTSGPHADILRAALPVAKKNGLDIKIVEFQDYVSPNEALAAGDLDANIFQTESYLGLMNKQRRYGLVPVGRTITLPLAFYSNRYKSFSQVPQGARIGIPNDPSSEGRARCRTRESLSCGLPLAAKVPRLMSSQTRRS